MIAQYSMDAKCGKALRPLSRRTVNMMAVRKGTVRTETEEW